MLLIGALLILIARRRHERAWWLIAVASAFLAWLYTLSLLRSIPVSFQVSVWRPEALFASQLELLLDPLGWEAVYAAATLLLSILITAVARPGEVTAAGRAMMLVYTALAVVAMLAGNLLTVATSWALLDLTAFAFLASVLKHDNIRSLVARLAVDGAGVLLVLGAAIAEASADGGAEAGGLRAPLAVALVSLAVLLRLGLMPPHFALPALPGVRRGLGTLLRFLPPAAALSVLGRSLGSGIPESAHLWLRAGGLLGIAVGGLRWVAEPDAVGGRRFLILGISGLGILASTVAGADPYVVISATGTLILLLGAVVSLSEVHAPFHRAFPSLGALFVVGLPFGPGVPVIGALAHGIASAQDRAIAAAGLLGALLLGLGVARGAFSGQSPWPSAERVVKILFGAGLLLPILAGVGLRLWSDRTIDPREAITSIGLAVLMTTAAFVLPRMPRRRLDRWRRHLHYLDPTPAYRLVWGLVVVILRALRGLGDLVEGEGAMLWTYVALLLVLLAVL